ncbi:type I-E CRISPR-associated protein Cas7/Cse4/CasC [Sedimentitalea sp. JM2-8]|uniref:Type I-E CRISPR-associated protein Cas7/Cse4/CasC n=1 Tax=Sedimentitalea xiamensis TaxID=3050037 RepID=A0ABT7FHX3_9RHOB|nr:type I-E CRISPR-associated protein Cas7/Cse4/CasC [Sedimentitalea xiamensis]MDK3074683.1 type I-E CRISPR-associated protein Cas7/Cse4/CasC [Sedimentitalea xiamensis]
MPEPRFLQIHTLTSYTATLLNRDDSGLAKRLTYGGALRTRVSSQCLKRHWRMAEDPHALHTINGADKAFRSRELVTRKVLGGLEPSEVVQAIEPAFQEAVYGGKGFKEKRSRQTLLFGERELAWLRDEAKRLVAESAGDTKAAAKATEQWGKDFKKNIAAMREATALPGGLTAALFGRMVTSDTSANITAPVHVAHAFTVHGEESESDYFTAVDDLSADEPGADTIQETELTSGLFYGYVVVDLPGLIDNLGSAAPDLAGPVLHNLVHLIAEVSPGAKLGSTAPYGRAGLMLLEAGDRQPRSLAEAFRVPCDPDMASAAEALTGHLAALDRAYATGEERRVLSLRNEALDGAAPGTLKELADWAATLPARLS